MKRHLMVEQQMERAYVRTSTVFYVFSDKVIADTSITMMADFFPGQPALNQERKEARVITDFRAEISFGRNAIIFDVLSGSGLYGWLSRSKV